MDTPLTIYLCNLAHHNEREQKQDYRPSYLPGTRSKFDKAKTSWVLTRPYNLKQHSIQPSNFNSPKSKIFYFSSFAVGSPNFKVLETLSFIYLGEDLHSLLCTWHHNNWTNLTFQWVLEMSPLSCSLTKWKYAVVTSCCFYINNHGSKPTERPNSQDISYVLQTNRNTSRNLEIPPRNQLRAMKISTFFSFYLRRLYCFIYFLYNLREHNPWSCQNLLMEHLLLLRG